LKKKIIFIQHWSSLGGSGISLYYTWESLLKYYDITVYIPEKPYDLYRYLRIKGLTPKTYNFVCGQIPYYSGGSSIFKIGFWYLLIKCIFQINYWRKIILIENPDIIMVNSKVLCWMICLFKNRKSVCFVRETIKGNPKNLINCFMKFFLEKFSVVSFLSNFDLFQTNLKNPLTVVSPDILNINEYLDSLGKYKACRLLKVDSSTFNLAFVGGIDKLKGVDIIVKAMCYLKNQNVRLIIAGNDISLHNSPRKWINKNSRFSMNIKKYLKNNGLDPYISFVGLQKDISIVYSASDVLIFPMKEPHQARPAFEIGVQKKTVIITNFNNIAEFIQHNKNGLVFESNNPKDLAEKILELKENESLRSELGKTNFQFTMSYHTPEFSINKLISILDKI